MASAKSFEVGENQLLRRLPRAALRSLPLSEISWTARELLYEADAPIRDVYFPLDGAISLVLPLRDGSEAEIASVGSEGMLGTPLVLGVTRSPAHALGQTAGRALRLGAPSFRRALAAPGPLRSRTQRYLQVFVDQLAQSIACNDLHAIEPRMCKCILLTLDRSAARELALTHESLARMLGVHRPSVSVAAAQLQRAGLIRYRRGRLTVVDRARLERAACECYAALRRAFRSLGR